MHVMHLLYHISFFLQSAVAKEITSQVMRNEPYKFDVALKYAKNRLADIVQGSVGRCKPFNACHAFAY